MRLTILFGTFFGIFAGTGWYVINRGYSAVYAVCLGRTLDAQLDKYPRNYAVFEEQAEAAARIHLKRIREGTESYCPPENWRGKWRLVKEHLSGSWLTTDRGHIAYQVAERAVNGRFKFPWRKEFDCVDEYRATRLRLPTGGKYVGQIANMSLYCGAAK